MTIRTGLAGVSLSCLLVTAGVQVRDLPSATDGYGGFAFPDEGGGRLLQISHLARPELLKTALCGGGRRLTLQFDRLQGASQNDGRQTGRNFDKLAGSVYTVLGNTIDPVATCFLPSEALLAESTILSIAAPGGPGACVQRQRFATLRARPVVHCWPLARLAGGKQVALLEFERRGKDALASLVFVDGSRTIFADVPAEYRRAGEDLWRVNDGGVLTPDGMQIVCALQRGGWYALAIVWAAGEGRALSLWISEGSDRFTTVIRDYWYEAA
jgi:hypothetical protein